MRHPGGEPIGSGYVASTMPALPGGAAGPRSDPRFEQYVLRLLDETRQEVDRADNKVYILFATVGGAAAVAGVAGAGKLNFSEFNLMAKLLLGVAGASLGASLLLLFFAIRPRIVRTTGTQLDYFGDFAGVANDDDLLVGLAAAAVHPVDRHVRLLRRLSRIVVTKYVAIHRAVVCFGTSMVIMVAAVAIHKL
jgi:hypothetical protein